MGLAKNWRYSKTAVLGGSITLKNPISDLKWAAVLGGGVLVGPVLGGAVLGGAVLGGRHYWEGQYWEGRLYYP